MSIIKIFANDIELNFKKSSLTLKKENNALSSSFKVTHSAFPFLIVEDENCKKALGSNDITSISKKKVIVVTVLEFGVKYYGELQQISIQKGYRKCNLKYSSEVLSIINNKIASFMPVVSVIPGEIEPIAYTEESTEVHSGIDNWETFPVSIMGSIFPEVKFQFPMMYWKNKYGINLNTEDAWYLFENHINKFVDEGVGYFFKTNYSLVDGSEVTTENYNVPSPQVFLLSPLHYIFDSIGWKLKGNFIDHELVKRILFFSDKDNLTKTILAPVGEFINIDSAPFNFISGGGYFDNGSYRKVVSYPITVAGRYKLKYSFEIEHAPSLSWSNWDFSRLMINPPGPDNTQIVFNQFLFYNGGNNILVEGEVEFSTDSVPNDLLVFYEDSYSNEPVNYSLELILLNTEKEFYQMHPTIELGRYVPDWTVGSYLNYLKNQFNLDVSLDDFKKEIILNLNENIDITEQPFILEKSLALTSFDLAANSSFVLKYENAIDASLFINKNEVANFNNNSDDFTSIIETKFKLIPRNGYTSELSEEVIDKEGVGLIIYEPINAPFTSENTVNNFNLNIPGTKGIYETFFRRWLKFRLNASRCEIDGFFTENEISKIYQLKSIYVDNQRYRIESLEYNEETNNYYSLKMILESVNF